MAVWTARNTAGWMLAALLSVGVALFSYRYLGPPNVTMGPNVLANPFAKPFLPIHAACAATALLVGAFQFLPAVRRRRTLHRWLGRVYVVGCLAGGVAGLLLASRTTAGPVAGAGFGLLAVIWIWTTSQAWLAARGRRFDEHRAWMIRSFALTFGAVTLRLYLPVAQIAHIPFMTAYVAIAWLAWVPNLALAELYLRRSRR